MKIFKRTCLLLVSCMVFTVVSHAQQMSKDQWEIAMREATQRRDSLQKDVDQLEADVLRMKTQDNSLAQQLDRCQDEILSMLGVTAAQEKEFSAFLDRIDGELNNLAKLSNQDLYMQKAQLDTVQAMITRAKGQKLSYLPENDRRIGEEQYRLNALKDSIKNLLAQREGTYTVGSWKQNRDCLWNIAKKPKIYDNAFLWPKIWQDNRDEIKNPDLIYKGEKLRIPTKAPMTAEEESALKTYWHDKTSFASSKSPKESKQ